MGDDEIIGLADAVNTKVSEKLTWLLLGVLTHSRPQLSELLTMIPNAIFKSLG